jgi:hypothetical protein
MNVRINVLLEGRPETLPESDPRRTDPAGVRRCAQVSGSGRSRGGPGQHFMPYRLAQFILR